MSSGLLVVDVQNCVVEGIGSAAATIATIGELVASARAHGRPIAWVQHEDTVDDDLPSGSDRWEIVPELVPAPEDIRVVKHHRSAFAETGLADRLRSAGVDRVVVVGVQSAFCVDMAGKHALAEGFNVTLVSDGHCNGPLQTDAGVLSDEQVRAMINRTWASLRHPSTDVRVLAASEITW